MSLILRFVNRDLYEHFSATIFVLGSTTGSLIGGVNAEKFGRKKAMLLEGGLMLIGLTMIGFLKSFPLILTGRYICGHAAGSMQSIIPAYISEISQPPLRNVTGLMFTIVFTSGLFRILSQERI